MVLFQYGSIGEKAMSIGESILIGGDRRRLITTVAEKVPILNWQAVGKSLVMEGQFRELARALPHSSKDHWPVYVPRELTHLKVINALKEVKIDIWSEYKDCDGEILIHDRDPAKNGPYGILIQSCQEADEGNKNVSADVLKERNHSGITSLERLVLELAFYLTTGEHLDLLNTTLCSGSQDQNGKVPSVGFYSYDQRKETRHELFILAEDSDTSESTICSRSIFSPIFL